MAKKHKDAIQQCEQRPHNLPLVEASNTQEKKVSILVLITLLKIALKVLFSTHPLTCNHVHYHHSYLKGRQIHPRTSFSLTFVSS